MAGPLPLSPRLGSGILHFSSSKHLRSTISSHLLGHLCCLHISPVENLFVVIHPDLSQAHLVASNDVGAFGKGVGALGAEHVAYHRAGDDLQLAPTLPHLPKKDRDGTFRRLGVTVSSLAALFYSQSTRPRI